MNEDHHPTSRFDIQSLWSQTMGKKIVKIEDKCYIFVVSSKAEEKSSRTATLWFSFFVASQPQKTELLNSEVEVLQ